MSDLLIYAKLLVTSIRSRMEYKVSFLFLSIGLTIFYLSQVGVIFVMLSRFNAINGWRAGEIAFLYGMLAFSQGLATTFFSPLNGFERTVNSGEFDRYLVRPLNPLVQVLASGFEISSFVHFMLGSVAIIYGSSLAGVQWSVTKVAFFLAVMAGAVLIQGAVRLTVSSVVFWTLKNSSLVHFFVYSSKEFIMYPISIYRVWIQIFLTLALPIGFINYYPSYYFLSKDASSLLFHPFLQFLTPLVGVASFMASLSLWNMGIKRYQSAGN